MLAPSDNLPLLSVDRVNVRFGKLLAVRDVSFALHGGDLLGLIGPNGAGKTTLLRSIASLQPTQLGDIRVMGEPVTPDSTDVLQYIGFTPDTPPALEELTVRDYLHFIGRGYRLPRHEIEERSAFWLEKVWLTEKADVKIKGLSRGMRQRIGLARTLMPNPHVVLLDEPAAGLDPAGRAQFRQLLVDLREQGKALIVSSHILSDMEEYCTHIGMMSAGRMVQYGTVRQVSQHGGASTDGRCRYEVKLARFTANLKQMLGGIDGISKVEEDGRHAAFDYASDAEAASSLLARLVSDGVPVASFTQADSGLEAAYLRAGIKQVD
jgi:ABC-2 type transport system ATP-binding protein